MNVTLKDEDYYHQMQEFPCAFNLVNANKITFARLTKTKHNILTDTDSENCKEELIRNNNLLTWLYFSLDNHDKAVEFSDVVVELTKKKNIASLGNRVYVMRKTGDEIEATKCLKILKNLRDYENYRELLTEAKAEQAYYYSRLGGAVNLKLTINLFSEAIREFPNNYLWKFGLGLAYRRVTHPNIFYSSSEPINVEEYNKNAIQYLFEVADNADSRLQALAYAQLVNIRKNHPPKLYPQYNDLFRGLDLKKLCEKALNKGNNMSSVLTQCGNALRKMDVDESIRLLEMSLTLSKKTTVYHYLGKSYVEKATQKNSCEQSRVSGAYGLNKDDELVQKAFECFKQAFETGKENFPAVFDLGQLLKETGQRENALKEFNKVTNSHISTQNHKLTVIKAYEQAGLIYLEKSKAVGRDDELEDLGKKKLTRAVAEAAELTLILPELKDKTLRIWNAFKFLETEIDRESPPNRYKQKVELLLLAREHGQIIEVVQKLRKYSEDDLGDETIITAVLESYLQEKQPENALTFQNLVAINPAVSRSTCWIKGPLRDLRVKVLLETIHGRLVDPNENATFLFQQLFQLCLDVCFGLHAKESNEQTDPVEGLGGDLLVVYDGDYDSENYPNSTMKAARSLKTIAISLFGLEAEENLKGCGTYGEFPSELQLREMMTYRVVLIVIGSEDRGRQFDAVLKCTGNESTEFTNQRVLVVDAGMRKCQVPLCLRQYECFKLEDIGGLGDIDHSPGGGRNGDDQLSSTDIIKQGFRDNVDAILELFCFIIGQQ